MRISELMTRKSENYLTLDAKKKYFGEKNTFIIRRRSYQSLGKDG